MSFEKTLCDDYLCLLALNKQQIQSTRIRRSLQEQCSSSFCSRNVLLFLKPCRGYRHAGVSWFSLYSRHLVRSRASNFRKPLAIMLHSSTSFHRFFGFFFFCLINLPSVVLLLDSFLHPFPSHAPTIAIFAFSETLPISLHPSFTNLLIVYFIFQGFLTYHSQHSNFYS